MEAENIEKLNFLLCSFLPNIFGFNMLSSNNDMINESEIPFTPSEISLLLNNDLTPVKKRLQLLNDAGFYKLISQLGDELMLYQEWKTKSILIQSDTDKEIFKEIILLLSISQLRLNNLTKGKAYFSKLEEIILKDTFTSIEVFDKYRSLKKKFNR